MWSKISSALKQREGNDSDQDHSDTPSTTPPPDPFRVNAATYYTHQTPPTPPSGVHSRAASREEDIIWSLRTQLALQQELCAQFEIDLGARDELVQALTARLDASEKENDKRKNVVRSWKKKAAELEKMCRHLEVVVDSSRRESMERSIMDEASGEALRQLHRQISKLEREKAEIVAERDSLAQTVGHSELEQVRAERDSLSQVMKETETHVLRLEEELRVTTEANAEAQHQLLEKVSQLQQEKSDIETERGNLSSEISRLRIHVQQLQKDSAVMEVTIVQLNKQRDQDKVDIGGLNIALESKQQELELVSFNPRRRRACEAHFGIFIVSGKTQTWSTRYCRFDLWTNKRSSVYCWKTSNTTFESLAEFCC